MSTISQDRAGNDFASRTLAELATTLPGATALFRKEKLDFCCGGQVSLGEAAAARNIDLAGLTAQLKALAEAAEPAKMPQDTDSLIAMIETRYHAIHRQELPELIRLARRVEAVHRDAEGVPRGLADLLELMADELDAHMQKEERVLFPMMRQGGGPMISHPIATMSAEHNDHAEHLRSLEALTNDFTPPAHACNSWRALYVGTQKLANDLAEHIHTENNILFPRFAS